jgi:hypothetical protein
VAESLYILISGRVRLLRADPDARTPIHVEEEVGGGNATSLHAQTCCSHVQQKVVWCWPAGCVCS